MPPRIAFEITSAEQLKKLNLAYNTDEVELPALYIYMGVTDNTAEHILIPHSLDEKNFFESIGYKVKTI